MKLEMLNLCIFSSSPLKVYVFFSVLLSFCLSGCTSKDLHVKLLVCWQHNCSDAHISLFMMVIRERADMRQNSWLSGFSWHNLGLNAGKTLKLRIGFQRNQQPRHTVFHHHLLAFSLKDWDFMCSIQTEIQTLQLLCQSEPSNQWDKTRSDHII